jgi:hypothetical protein
MEKLIGVLASLLSYDASELTTALKDGDKFLEGDALADKVKEVLAPQVAKIKNEQVSRGMKDAGKKYRAAVKSLWPEMTDTTNEAETINGLFEFAQQQAGSQTEIDETNPKVKAIVKTAVDLQKAKYGELQASFEKYKQEEGAKLARKIGIVEMTKAITEAKVILGDKPTARIDAIAKLINWNEVSIDENGNPILVDGDKNPKTDDAGKPIPFSAHVVGIASELFGVHKQDPGAGGSGAGGGGKKSESDPEKGDASRFKNQQEYDDFLKRNITPDERYKAMLDYQAFLDQPES